MYHEYMHFAGIDQVDSDVRFLALTATRLPGTGCSSNSSEKLSGRGANAAAAQRCVIVAQAAIQRARQRTIERFQLTSRRFVSFENGDLVSIKVLCTCAHQCDRHALKAGPLWSFALQNLSTTSISNIRC